MDKSAVIKIIDIFRERLSARGVRAQKIILYGSHANESEGPKSDIDVVVISEDFTGKDFWERVDILADVIFEVSAPLEAVAMTQEEWDSRESFIVDFACTGEVLYAT